MFTTKPSTVLMVSEHSASRQETQTDATTTVAATTPVRVHSIFTDPATTRLVKKRVDDESTIQMSVTADEALFLDRLEAHGAGVDCVLVGHDPPALRAPPVLDQVQVDGKDYAILVVTQHGSEQLASRVVASGADRYIPITASTPHDGPEASHAQLRTQIEDAVRQHQLRSGHELYRTLTEDIVASVDIGLLIRDPSGRVVWLNRTVERYLDLTGDELVDRQFQSVIEDDLSQTVVNADAFQHRVADGPPIDGYECQIATDGRVKRILEYHDRRIASGAFAGGRVGLFYDVTSRRDRERNLERYETMVETVADGLYTLDAEYNFTFVNKALTEITGYSRDELVGAHVSKLIDAETRAALQDNEDFPIEHECTEITAECEMQTANDESVPIEVRFRPLPFDDEFRGTTGVVRDVSERKERERKLRRQNERLNNFASVISHDLREPLRTVTNYLGLLERRYRDELDDDAEDFIQFANAGASRMQVLIDDLLALSRQGQIVGEKSPVDLGARCRAAWRNVSIGDGMLSIEGDLGTVQADGTRLQEAFENLFSNAISHAGPDVQITVGTVDGGFYVADDGEGIATDDLSAIFEYQYTTGGESGGLGLAIVNEIVEAHGWEIQVTESATGGARFEILTVPGS